MEKFLKYLNLENTPTLAHLDSKKRIREVNAVKFPGGHLVQWIILDDEENLWDPNH